MKIFIKLLAVTLTILITNSCGGGGDSGTDNQEVNTNSNTQSSQNLAELKATYEIPFGTSNIGGLYPSNILIDGDSIIIAGGLKGMPSGAQHDGHIAFVNKIIKIDLLSGIQKILDLNATSGHPFGSTVANGRSHSTSIHKLDYNKYLIGGGFQYADTFEIVDFTDDTVKVIPSHIQIPDTQNGGFTTIKYFSNRQGNVSTKDGNVFFFGYNDGLYDKGFIAKFNKKDENLSIMGYLSMARASTGAYLLDDDRIMIVGGWDGSAYVTPDSATRRVEIFDPNDNSIVRVSDYPEPIHAQIYDDTLTEANKICIGKYQYTVSLDSWDLGCDIKNNDPYGYAYNAEGGYYTSRSDITGTSGSYRATLSNGNLVYIEIPTFSKTFSDEINGYPITTPMKFNVYSK